MTVVFNIYNPLFLDKYRNLVLNCALKALQTNAGITLHYQLTCPQSGYFPWIKTSLTFYLKKKKKIFNINSKEELKESS